MYGLRPVCAHADRRLAQALPLSPIASDKLGRRKALFIGSCIMLAGVAVQVIASDIQTLIGARAISTYTPVLRVDCRLNVFPPRPSLARAVGFGLCFTTNAGASGSMLG